MEISEHEVYGQARCYLCNQESVSNSIKITDRKPFLLESQRHPASNEHYPFTDMWHMIVGSQPGPQKANASMTMGRRDGPVVET